MAQQSKQTGNKQQALPALSRAEELFTSYNQWVSQPSARIIHLLAIPVGVFGLLGFLWALPFPVIRFLGHYNGFLNWSSFLIAIMVYYYLRVAPTVSYVFLLFLLLCAYGITELVTYQVTAGIKVWLICLILFLVALGVCIATANKSKLPTITNKLWLLVAAPLWEIQLLLNSLSRKKQ